DLVYIPYGPSVLFYSLLSPLDLHSFPTRRSSDLLAALEQHLQRVAEVLQNVGAEDEIEQPVEWRQAVVQVGRNEIDIGRMRNARDRKSTRLNSSHGSISYAVFCLKKKSKNIKHQQ